MGCVPTRVCVSGKQRKGSAVVACAGYLVPACLGHLCVTELSRVACSRSASVVTRSILPDLLEDDAPWGEC